MTSKNNLNINKILKRVCTNNNNDIVEDEQLKLILREAEELLS